MPTRDQHVSTEQLADLLAGVLPEAQAGSVAAHVSGCAECAAVRDRLAALPAILAADPAPVLPAEVADRLDATIATESDRRAASEETVVVPLRIVRRDRVRHWLAGAATAAAALVAISVGADVAGIGSGAGTDGSAPDDAAAGASSPQEPERLQEEEQDEASGAQTAPEDGDYSALGQSRVRLPEVAADDFAADVELLYDSGAFRTRANQLDQSPPNPAAAELYGYWLLARDDACGDRALRRSDAVGATGPGGTAGPFVLLDDQVARLVAAGPADRRTVRAYSCDSGRIVTSAIIDLTR